MKHLNTFRPHLRTLLTGMVCAATALLAPACGKDSAASNGFFDEQGVWLLTQVQLDPSTQDSDTKPAAEDGFWMRFGKDKDGKLVVATAACGIEGDDDKKTAFHVMHTGCADENLDDKRIWQCNCYDYSFDDKTMVWTERKSKKAKKKKKEEEDEDLLALNLYQDDEDEDESDKSDKEADKSEDDKDEDEDKKEAEEELTSTVIKAHKDMNEVYVFTGMPNFDNEDLDEENEDGVFQSNGMTSKHTFAKRTIKRFKGTGCAKVCGIVDADEDEDEDEDDKDESDKEAEKSGDDSSDDDSSDDDDESEDE